MNADLSMLIAQTDAGGGGLGGLIGALIGLAVFVIIFVGCWKMFTKAGQPGWGFIIPFYNIICYLKIADRPLWWFFLGFVPIVNLVIAVIVVLDIARNFGKGTLFALGMIFLGGIFFPILGYGDAEYRPVPH